MSTRGWWSIILVLLVVIVGLMWILFATPARVEAPTATSTPPAATSTQPLSTRVVVTSPKERAKVGKTFTVSGEAPGPWYFEASFPIKVVDANNNFIGSSIAHAQGDWMTTGQVPFTATVTVEGYSGPAILVLLRDNPSGMPENDDSVSVAITIQ